MNFTQAHKVTLVNYDSTSEIFTFSIDGIQSNFSILNNDKPAKSAAELASDIEAGTLNCLYAPGTKRRVMAYVPTQDMNRMQVQACFYENK